MIRFYGQRTSSCSSVHKSKNSKSKGAEKGVLGSGGVEEYSGQRFSMDSESCLNMNFYIEKT